MDNEKNLPLPDKTPDVITLDPGEKNLLIPSQSVEIKPIKKVKK